MQVLPIPIQYICTLRAIETGIWRYMYLAMTDFWTGSIYDFITVVTIVIMHISSRRLVRSDKSANILKLKSVINYPLVKIFVLVGMFAPVILSVALAPNPRIYFSYSYFYMNSYNELSAAYIYHANVVTRLCFITVIFTIIQYFSKSDKHLIFNIEVLAAVFLCTWINGKRAILIFMLFGILAVDFLDSTQDYKKLIKKAILFAIISLVYFEAFSSITGKQSESEFFDLYNMYFSRLGCEKLSIYDHLYTNAMLEYPGQTLLYDLLFFVPRELWENKPSFFATYFTGYAYYGVGTHFLPSNLLVNIWTEFYANFGLIGHFIALLIVILLAKKAEISSSYLVYLSTAAFLVSYMSFGFEFIVLIIYAAMIACFVFDKYRIHFQPGSLKLIIKK